MPDLALPRQLHAIGQRAIAEATSRRATSVGAEHVLLAIAANPDAPAARALAAHGLDCAGLTAALVAERSRSLAAADIDPIDPASLASAPRTVSILRAELGTVPRALAIANVDRTAIVASLRTE
jgi:ATP-dependent Clp protease ATP-binding subunit ClpA